MAQITAKRAVEAWHWIHNNPHHICGTEFHDDGSIKAIYYKNYHDILRVPERLMEEVSEGIRANKRPFDTRMFALTAKAKRAVT